MLKQTGCILLLFFTILLSLHAAEGYTPQSGDKELDSLLVEMNIKNKNKQKQFIQLVADEFQVPVEKVAELFTHYEFTVADVLMTLSIADASGQPVNNVSRAYFENRELGWRYVLQQLNIPQRSAGFKQVKKDARGEFLH